MGCMGFLFIWEFCGFNHAAGAPHAHCLTAIEQTQYFIFYEPSWDIRLSKRTSFILLNKLLTSFSRPNFQPQYPCISNN